VVILAALVARLWVVATHTYVVFPDETFQYLEPAHRLAFGSGVNTWEYLDGIRSWFLPGVLAGVMWVTSTFDPAPEAYVFVVRLLCVLASLSVPFVGFQLTVRRFGPAVATLVGMLSALSYETVYFAPVIMTEPLATYAAFLAIWIGDIAADTNSPRRLLFAAGLLFGLAASLRYQFAPILCLAALLQHVRQPRALAIVVLGAAIVVVLILGALDTLTWGFPFQSVWLNYQRNETQGVSTAMGTEPWPYYFAYWVVAWGPAAIPLLSLSLLGMIRFPVLGALAAAMIVHSFIPHKELRFIFLAMAAMPMLVGVGLGCLLHSSKSRRPIGASVPAAAAIALAISAYMSVMTYQNATPADAWHRDRSTLVATGAARNVPGVCGLAIRSIWLYRTGGYVYWHQNGPIYFLITHKPQPISGADRA
jgi:hypothetical protein